MNLDLTELVNVVGASLAAKTGAPRPAARAAVELEALALLGDPGARAKVRSLTGANRELAATARILLWREPGYWIAHYAVEHHLHPLPRRHPWSAAIRGAFGEPNTGTGTIGGATQVTGSGGRLTIVGCSACGGQACGSCGSCGDCGGGPGGCSMCQGLMWDAAARMEQAPWRGSEQEPGQAGD